MRVRAHVYVRGRVQGVFFRYETRELARKLGIQGWVRNLPDGRVEAVFEGEKKMVEEIIKFCQHGPPGAHVEGVDVRWEEPEGEPDFYIRW